METCCTAGLESDAGSRKWGTYTPTSLPQSQLVSQSQPTAASPPPASRTPPPASPPFHPPPTALSLTGSPSFRLCVCVFTISMEMRQAFLCCERKQTHTRHNFQLEPQEMRSELQDLFYHIQQVKQRKFVRCPTLTLSTFFRLKI